MVVVLLILISLSIALMFLFFFYWNMKSGQYDDIYTPGIRMLFDDEKDDASQPSSSAEK
jgi:cbb3-type cytochrome oxidase maturation protein